MGLYTYDSTPIPKSIKTQYIPHYISLKLQQIPTWFVLCFICFFSVFYLELIDILLKIPHN